MSGRSLRRWTTLALAGVAGPALAQGTAARPALPAAGTAALARDVDALFRQHVRPDGPGCAVGVYRDGQVVLARGYGLASLEHRRPITDRTTFELGSASKPFTALAALLLERDGRLALDDDVRRRVPELRDWGAPIRVRDLLHHTSGLRDWGTLAALSGDGEAATMRDFIALLAAQRALNFTPGTRHEYSHSDFELLALVVERAAGEPFGRFLAREVLRPMGMNGSAVRDGATLVPERAAGHRDSAGHARVHYPTTSVVGGIGMHVSIRDLAGLDRQLATGSVGGPAVLARMLTLPTLADGDTIPYAYGLRRGRHLGLRTISRGGHQDGMRSEYVRYPDRHFAVATLCNSEALDARRLANRVAELYLGTASRPERPRLAETPPRAIALAPEALARFAGTYRSLEQPHSPIHLVVRDGALGEVLYHEQRDDTLWRLIPVTERHFAGIGATGNIGHYFFDEGPGTAMRARIVYDGDTLEHLERVADSLVWRPAAGALAAYAGRWYSEDLDTAWRLDVEGDRLVLRRRGGPALTLRPVAPDEFVRGFGWWAEPTVARLRFHRDAAGRPTHFTISTPPGDDSVRDLRFDRIPPP